MVGYRIEIIYILNLYPNNGVCLLIENTLLPDVFLLHSPKVKLRLNIEVFSIAFVKDIGRNGVLYSGIWP